MKKYGWILGLVLALTVFALPMASADSPVDGRAGRAEMRFLEGMIDHHQMALDMALNCLERATSESVVTVCQNVINAQTAEIEMMQGWLLEWYNIQYAPMSMDSMESMGMMEMMHMMHNEEKQEGNAQGGHAGHGASAPATTPAPYVDPPMMMGMFAGFNQVEGIEYEIAWLESMADHHDDAIHMAERLLMRVPADVGHAELLAMAEKIISDQTAEIELMEALIVTLSE